MESYATKECTFALLCKGSLRYTKMSYPVRYGFFSVLTTKKGIYHFNLNGELIFAQSRDRRWPDPQEWLKRSVGDHWIYLSTGGYTGVFEAIGEYYLPNFLYASNSLLGGVPFNNPAVSNLIENWYDDVAAAVDSLRDRYASPGLLHEQFTRIRENTPERLASKAATLVAILGGDITVLPPDARHVEYDLIPVTLARGCLYKCTFCKVKNASSFAEMDRSEIERQLQELRQFYGDNLVNYNSVFLGEHDGLACSSSFLLQSVELCYRELHLQSSHMHGANFFIFASVDALLGKDLSFYQKLNAFPAFFFINVGLESGDQATLDLLGKPVQAETVRAAFRFIQEINRSCSKVEVTANFLMGDELPFSHRARFIEMVHSSVLRPQGKGTIYLSPLKFATPSREQVKVFHGLKLLSRFPTYLYIIQRL